MANNSGVAFSLLFSIDSQYLPPVMNIPGALVNQDIVQTLAAALGQWKDMITD